MALTKAEKTYDDTHKQNYIHIDYPSDWHVVAA